MTFRTVLFWIHLGAGLLAGTVVFIMSFTGAAISLQPQILAWAERDQRVVQPPSPEAVWLGPDALMASVRQQRPEATVTGVTLEHGGTQAAAVTLSSADAPAGPGPAPQTTIYVNPYTGAILGQVDPTSPWRRFFRINTDWHRYLALAGESRTTGRWITGVSNAAFLFLGISGLFLWIPRIWSAAAIRAVALFRRGLSGKARDFNWHNVIGVWSASVLDRADLHGPRHLVPEDVRRDLFGDWHGASAGCARPWRIRWAGRTWSAWGPRRRRRPARGWPGGTAVWPARGDSAAGDRRPR